MLGDLNALLAATAAFVCGHFLLSSDPLRRPLRRRLGQGGFQAGYSLIVAAAFIWMLAAYGEAPVVDVWYPAPALAWVPVAVMPLAIYLVLAGLTTPNPTLVGAETRLDMGGVGNPARGVISITRHPMLWGIALWAGAHLLVNGDAASMILMGGLLALALGGMAHIDARREAALGAAWGPIAMDTSALPFAAVLSGRAKIDWKGIGWWRPALSLAIYAALYHGHRWIAGVPVSLG